MNIDVSLKKSLQRKDFAETNEKTKPQTYQTSRYYSQETHQVKKFTGTNEVFVFFWPCTVES